MRCARISLVSLVLAVQGLGAVPASAQEPLEGKCSEMPQGSGPRLATGPADGMYLRFGRYLRQSAKQLDLRPCRTEGSLENLLLLSQNKVEYAIVQGDVLHKGWEGEEGPQHAKKDWATIDFDKLRLVRWLFSERLQITAGPHSYVSSLADLRRKRVWLERQGSGTYATSWEVLRAAGIERTDLIEVPNKDYEEANKKLLGGGLDAVFRMTPVPLNLERAMNPEDPNYPSTITFLFDKNPEVRLLSLERPVIDRILQSPSYVEVPIYRGTYPQQKNGALTIGIEAMLVTRLGDSVEEQAKIANLNAAISESRAAIQREMDIELDLLDKKANPEGSSEERAIFKRVHSAAVPALAENRYKKYVPMIAAALAALVLLALGARSKRVLEALGGGSKYLVTGGFLASACVVFGAALWFFERRFSFDFKSPVSATESLIVYFARGLKSETLMTQNGQLVALLALAVIATLVHSINSDALGEGVSSWSGKLTRWFLKRAANVQPDQRHFVILNWDQHAADKVAEWTKDPANAKSKFTIVSPNITEIQGAAESGRIQLLRGDPKSMESLEKAGVQDAKFVLICSAWCRADPFDRRGSMDVELADSYTIRAIHGIRAQELRNHAKRSVPIDAEIYLESNWSAAKNAGGPGTDVRPPKNGFTRFASAPEGRAGLRTAQPN
ncbi:MAG TPA: TAXI family TRAP transporter solute-binding subunit [Candidatus Bathyarchaeia archaeon]|nr:TAXI family TRAP transporter solute-binding subunit [Candidatus Bathyarchaeia archaeon]